MMHAPVLMNLHGDTSMDNCNMTTLSIEPIKNGSSPCTTIIVFPLIQLAVSILLYTRNAATASKPNVVRVINVLK